MEHEDQKGKTQSSGAPRLASKLDQKSMAELALSDSSTAVIAPTQRDHFGDRVKMEHRALLIFSMELDEERNAANVAAKEAMAMITRLQAEKAAIRMEALQYQRMMEEQAEYEQEAFHEMLMKREEEMTELEVELEGYRAKYGSFEDQEALHEMLTKREEEMSELEVELEPYRARYWCLEVVADP